MHRACLVVSWSSVELVLEMYICPDHDELTKSNAERDRERKREYGKACKYRAKVILVCLRMVDHVRTYKIVRVCGIQRKTSRHLSASTLKSFPMTMG